MFGAPVRLHVIMAILGRVEDNKGQECKGRKGKRDRDGQRERQIDRNTERTESLFLLQENVDSNLTSSSYLLLTCYDSFIPN